MSSVRRKGRRERVEEGSLPGRCRSPPDARGRNTRVPGMLRSPAGNRAGAGSVGRSVPAPESSGDPTRSRVVRKPSRCLRSLVSRRARRYRTLSFAVWYETGDLPHRTEPSFPAESKQWPWWVGMVRGRRGVPGKRLSFGLRIGSGLLA